MSYYPKLPETKRVGKPSLEADLSKMFRKAQLFHCSSTAVPNSALGMTNSCKSSPR